jgi:hypothetical protein
VSPLGLYVLSLLLWAFPPGRSQLSSVELACERRAEVECAIEGARWDPCFRGWRVNRKGDEGRCRVADAGSWVRDETREEGAARLELVAQAGADAAEHLGAAWDRGPADLARMLVSAGGWSTGFKERIQVGAVRGPAGELCFLDLRPDTLVKVLPYDLSKLRGEELAAAVTGREYSQVRRCFDAGALLLVRARREADRRCKGYPPEFSTFALYATGGACFTKGTAERPDWLATPRYQWLGRFRARKHTTFPDWYTPPKGDA